MGFSLKLKVKEFLGTTYPQAAGTLADHDDDLIILYSIFRIPPSQRKLIVVTITVMVEDCKLIQRTLLYFSVWVNDENSVASKRLLILFDLIASYCYAI